VSVLSTILGGIAKPVTEYFSRRQEIKAEDRQQERAIKKAMTERQVELIKEGLTADMNWEMEFARQAQTSWKDEYILLILSLPFVLCFIPKDFSEWQGGAYYVMEGLKAIDQLPAWYQLLVGIHFCATIGVRFWRKSQYDTE
jgi:hypothetical protein